MKIKPDCAAQTDDFWYDLFDGGYLTPESLLEDEEDIQKVKEAMAVLSEFRESCEDEIEEFYR